MSDSISVKSPYQPKILWAALGLATFLFVLDGLYIQQPVISFIALVVVVVKAARALKHHRWALHRRAQLKNLALYTVAVVLSIGLFYINMGISRDRSMALVSAIEAYRLAEGTYPKSLAQLVPKYIEQVPKSKLGFGLNDFHYTPQPATLMYVSVPPFGRPYYVFEEKTWKYMD